MFLANLYNQVSEQVKNAINEPVEPKKMAEVKDGGHKATLVPDSAKVFQLPITYLDKSKIHTLSDIVAKDLELTESPLEKCMYDYVFDPNTKFAKETVHKWQTYFTSDVDFLHDTQNVVKEMGKMELSKINQALMGDLFSYPIYDFDTIILRHTQETISKINCKYIVKFYISRIIHDKRINKDSFGSI